MAAAYTAQQTSELVEDYLENPVSSRIPALATKYRRTPKSIIAKLSKEGVYHRKDYKDKRGRVPRSKLEIVNSIEDLLGVSRVDNNTLFFETLVKASREDCIGLEKEIQKLVKDFSEVYSQYDNLLEEVEIAKQIRASHGHL